MTISCDVANLRLFGEHEDGTYLDVPYQCMKPTCQRCWRTLIIRRIWATRLYLNKMGMSKVWIGIISPQQRVTARKFKERNKDRPDILVANMLSTFSHTDEVAMLATCNMLPNSEGALREVEVEEALRVYQQWCEELRPKRMTADWELKFPGRFRGKFTASPKTIDSMWTIMNDRWGHKPGDVPEDPTVFERRMFTALDEVKAKKAS